MQRSCVIVTRSILTLKLILDLVFMSFLPTSTNFLCNLMTVRECVLKVNSYQTQEIEKMADILSQVVYTNHKLAFKSTQYSCVAYAASR